VKGWFFRGRSRGVFGSSRIPVREGGVVVGLDDPDREGEGGEPILDEGLGDVVSHFLGKLHDPESRAAVEGCVIVFLPPDRARIGCLPEPPPPDEDLR